MLSIFEIISRRLVSSFYTCTQLFDARATPLQHTLFQILIPKHLAVRDRFESGPLPFSDTGHASSSKPSLCASSTRAPQRGADRSYNLGQGLCTPRYFLITSIPPTTRDTPLALDFGIAAHGSGRCLPAGARAYDAQSSSVFWSPLPAASSVPSARPSCYSSTTTPNGSAR